MSLSPPEYQRQRRYGPLPQLNARGLLVQTYQHIVWHGLGKGYSIQHIEYPVGSFPAFTTMADPMEDEEELPFTRPPPRRRGPLLQSHRQKTKWEIAEEEYLDVWERHLPSNIEKMRKLKEEQGEGRSTTTTNTQSDATKSDEGVSDAQGTETVTELIVEATNHLKTFTLLVLPFLQDMIWPPLVTFILAYLSFHLLYTHRHMVLDQNRKLQLPSMADIYKFICALTPIALCLFISFFAISGVILGFCALVLRALVEHYTGLTTDDFLNLIDSISEWLAYRLEHARPVITWISNTFPGVFSYLRSLLTELLNFPKEFATFMLEPTSPFPSPNAPIFASTFRFLASALSSVCRFFTVAFQLVFGFVSTVFSNIRSAAHIVYTVCPLVFYKAINFITGLYYDFNYMIRATLRCLTRPQFWAGCVIALMFLRICIDRKVVGAIIASAFLLLFTHNWAQHINVYPHEPRPVTPPPITRFYFETPSPRQVAARSSPRKVFT